MNAATAIPLRHKRGEEIADDDAATVFAASSRHIRKNVPGAFKPGTYTGWCCYIALDVAARTGTAVTTTLNSLHSLSFAGAFKLACNNTDNMVQFGPWFKALSSQTTATADAGAAAARPEHSVHLQPFPPLLPCPILLEARQCRVESFC